MMIISVGQLKEVLGNAVTDADDEELRRIIEFHSSRFENYLNRPLLIASYKEKLYGWRGEHFLSATPVKGAVAIEIIYKDGTSDLLDDTDFTVDLTTGELYIFPETERLKRRSQSDFLTVLYTGGYGISAGSSVVRYVGWSDAQTPTDIELNAEAVARGTAHEFEIPERKSNGFLWFAYPKEIEAPDSVFLDGNKTDVSSAFDNLGDVTIGETTYTAWATGAAQDYELLGTGERVLTLGGVDPSEEGGVLMFPENDRLGQALAQAMVDQCREHWSRREAPGSETVNVGDGSSVTYQSPSRFLPGVRDTLNRFRFYPAIGV